MQICYFNSQCLIPVTRPNAIKDEKYTKYLWYKTLKVTSALINGSEHAILCFLEPLCTCTIHLGCTRLQQEKLKTKKFKLISENLLLPSISQVMVAPSQRSPKLPPGSPTSTKSSSHLVSVISSRATGTTVEFSKEILSI